MRKIIVQFKNGQLCILILVDSDVLTGSKFSFILLWTSRCGTTWLRWRTGRRGRRRRSGGRTWCCWWSPWSRSWAPPPSTTAGTCWRTAPATASPCESLDASLIFRHMWIINNHCSKVFWFNIPERDKSGFCAWDNPVRVGKFTCQNCCAGRPYTRPILNFIHLSDSRTQLNSPTPQDSSPNRSELSSSSATLFFHWSKAKGNGNGGRLCSCLMVWEAASDWSKQYFSSTTHWGKRKLGEVG